MAVYKNDNIMDLFMVDELGPEANMQLASPELVNYYTAKKNRVIWLTKEIDDSLFEEEKLILEWNREDEAKNIPVEKRKKIFLLLHSFGGDLFSCFSFVDIMNLSKTPIVCVNMACAMSAGALIFIHGHERYCLKNSTALLHNGSSASAGNYNDLVEQNKSYKKMVQRMQDMIVTQTKITKTQLTRKLKSDWYIDANEQVEYGLCSKIVEDISELL